MATFLTRLELHGTDSKETYDDLHDSMEKAGFFKVISDIERGQLLKLQNAEYLFEDKTNTSTT